MALRVLIRAPVAVRPVGERDAARVSSVSVHSALLCGRSAGRFYPVAHHLLILFDTSVSVL